MDLNRCFPGDADEPVSCAQPEMILVVVDDFVIIGRGPRDECGSLRIVSVNVNPLQIKVQMVVFDFGEHIQRKQADTGKADELDSPFLKIIRNKYAHVRGWSVEKQRLPSPEIVQRGWKHICEREDQ